MFETLKTLGAFVGLAVGAFTLYDRLWGSRPLLSLGVDQGTQRRFLMVTNSTAQHIAIIGFSALPNIFAVARAPTVGATVRAAAGDTFQLMMKSSGEARFPLVTLVTDGRNRDLDARIAILFMWWRKSVSLWLPQFPKIIIISTARLRSIVEQGLQDAPAQG
jgi:hypothetical protein